MQESPVVQEFVMMDLCPRFDEALLRPWQSATDALNRIEGEHRLEFLIDRMGSAGDDVANRVPETSG